MFCFHQNFVLSFFFWYPLFLEWSTTFPGWMTEQYIWDQLEDGKILTLNFNNNKIQNCHKRYSTIYNECKSSVQIWMNSTLFVDCYSLLTFTWLKQWGMNVRYCSFDFNTYRQKFFQGLQNNRMSNNPFFLFRNIGFGFAEYMEHSTKCFDVKD